jgi:hypothetical protein
MASSGGADTIDMPGGASVGAVRASAALNDLLRSEPHTQTTLTGSAMTILAPR